MLAPKAVLMTKQESFKRRIRERMAKTGERYGAARRSLLEAASVRSRRWISEPEVSDDSVRAATGRGWDQWCDLIDDWRSADNRSEQSALAPWDHKATAARLRSELDVDLWWCQGVTVGYERITGLRLPGQMADGTFTANKSKTITVDAAILKAMLAHDDDRADLFPGLETTLRSKPTSKVQRIQIGPGVAQIGIEDRGDGRAKVVVQHEKLPSADDVPEWKHYWSDWLDALDG